MSGQNEGVSRRQFLTTTLQTTALVAAPMIVPASALGRGGAVAPSERITVGGIGIGSRGTGVLMDTLAWPDAQVVAVCDVRAAQLEATRDRVNKWYDNQDCAIYHDFRDLLSRTDIDAVLVTTGSNWHALASVMAARAGKDVYSEKPCSKNIMESIALRDTFRRTGRIFQVGAQKRNTPHNVFAVQLARSGALGKLHTLYAHPQKFDVTGPTGWLSPMQPVLGDKYTFAGQPEWVSPHPAPPVEDFDWDMYMGAAAWRPYPGQYPGNGFEKGGGMVGPGVLEWGTHSADLCQWVMEDHAPPVEYHPLVDGQARARYANGVELIFRTSDWLTAAPSVARFEGDAGWVETTNDAPLLSTPEVLNGKVVPQTAGHSSRAHVRDFLNCIKSRNQTRANAEAACNTHIACHATNIAIMLGRKLRYDPQKNEFMDDDQANRLRGEALREHWHF